MWSELHPDLLELIFKRVGVIEYLMCACVCKSWRSVATSFKQKFMASQRPLVFLKSQHADNYCYFYDMFHERVYSAALPHLAGTKCYGFTCGYLFLSAGGQIWLVNPFTRHELEFPTPLYPYSHIILASLANSDQEFVVVAFSRLFPYLQFCRSGDVNWNVFRYDDKPWRLIDVAVCKGKIYVLSSYGQIWTLNLNGVPTLTMVHVTNGTSIAAGRLSLHLVASHEELYIARVHPNEDIRIHKLDFEEMKWERVNLQDEVLFLADMKCCGLTFPIPSWNDIGHMNRVWYLRYDPQEEITGWHMALYISEISRYRVPVIPVDWTWKPPRIFFYSPIWYFPHLSSSVQSVHED